jgi:hypothetical protein
MELKINKTYIGLKLTINNKKDQTILFRGVKRRKKDIPAINWTTIVEMRHYTKKRMWDTFNGTI